MAPGEGLRCLTGETLPAKSLSVKIQEYTAVIRQDDGWWIGWLVEIPEVNCQQKEAGQNY